MLVHYLNVPAVDDSGKPCGPVLCSINTDRKEWAKWSKEELIGQLKPMCELTLPSFWHLLPSYTQASVLQPSHICYTWGYESALAHNETTRPGAGTMTSLMTYPSEAMKSKKKQTCSVSFQNIQNERWFQRFFGDKLQLCLDLNSELCIVLITSFLKVTTINPTWVKVHSNLCGS